MNEDKKQLFSRYSEIVGLVKQLEEEKDKLAEGIFSEMTTLEVDQIKNDFGTFYFTSRKSWKYPDVIKEKEVEVKTLKKQAEESGEATFEEKKSLAYKSK